MMRTLPIMILLWCLTSAANAQDAMGVYKVTYISLDLIYLDGGRADGLSKGDRPVIRRGDSIVATLEIAHVAAHSVSCTVVNSSTSIRIGDVAYFRTAISPQLPPAVPVPSVNRNRGARRLPTNETASMEDRIASPVISGSLSLRTSHWNDHETSDLDYEQSTAGLRLDVRNLFSAGLSLSLRTGGRHNERRRAYSSGARRSDWIGSIYELAVVWDSPGSPLAVHAGRVTPRRVGTAGRLDGVTVEYRMSSHWRTGLFAGIQPRWQYASSQLNLTKYGVYVGIDRGEYRGTRATLTVAAMGEYHASTMSREFIYAQGQIDIRRRLSLSQIIELDVNRGWRRRNAGESVSLSNVYLSVRYRFSSFLSGGVTYDNRRNHWSYHTRTVADSLFDDNLRHGLRTRWSFSLPAGLALNTGAGYRKRTADPAPTYSYSAGIRKSGLWFPQTGVSLDAAGFSGPRQEGYNLSARVDHSLTRRLRLGGRYGIYRYRMAGDSAYRTDRRVDLSLRADIMPGLYLNGEYEIRTGDNTTGNRSGLGIGYRF